MHKCLHYIGGVTQGAIDSREERSRTELRTEVFSHEVRHDRILAEGRICDGLRKYQESNGIEGRDDYLGKLVYSPTRP